MTDVMSFPPTPGDAPHARALRWLHAELAALRAELAQLAEEVTTHRVTVVDPDGRPRIHLTTEDETARTVLLDADGFARATLVAEPDRGALTLRARTTAPHPTAAELFALDAEPDDENDRPGAGLDLIDRGDTVARLVLSEGLPPRLHVEPPGN